MRGRWKLKDVAMIVVVALLVAIPVGRISYSFGGSNASKATSGTVAPTLDMIKTMQADQAAAQQATNDAKAEIAKTKAMSLTDNEKQMMSALDKVVAAAAAGQKANADVVKYQQQLYMSQHH
jgi:hypothetical protein